MLLVSAAIPLFSGSVLIDQSLWSTATDNRVKLITSVRRGLATKIRVLIKRYQIIHCSTQLVYDAHFVGLITSCSEGDQAPSL